MEELIKGFEDSFTPNSIGVEQSMVYNFSEWIMKYISPMRKLSQPHVFKIFKVDRKAKIVCKQWTTDKVYKECVGSMDYLINEIPKDAPEAICPIYNELDKVKDSITLAKPFLNSRQQTQWQNFFKDKEEEEFDFKAESNFKLLELSEYVKQKRLEKSRNYQPVTIPQIVTDDKDMEPVMASSKPIQCRPCQEGKVNTKADIWCYNCDEGLCSTCSSHHKKFKGTRDHKTIDIKSYKPSTQAITTECDKHDQQLNLYCPSHLMPCCDECISTSHSKCTGIKSLASVVEKTKIEKSTQSVQKQIDSIKHFLDKLINNKSKNIKRCEQEKNNIKESILKIRKDINKHLTDLEKKLCNEADTIWDEEKSKETDLISEIEEKQNNLKEMQEHLHTVIPHTSKLQSFLGLHQIEQQVHQCQQYADDLENDGGAKEFNIKMKLSEEIENILSKLKSLESLGKVMVVKTETDMTLETSVRRKAQVESRVQSNINNMTMNIETKIEINIEVYISDMICLMDGRVIVVEHGGKVNLFTSDGKLQKQLPIPGGAWSVTQINQDTIAITYPDEEAINIFNMENETVTKVITLDKQCYGLSFSNNSLTVGLSDDEIRIIDMKGNTQKSIQVDCASYLYYIVYCNDSVIYSDCNGKAVTCVDESGKQIWQYTQDLSRPYGLCKDTYGNIIVADCDSDSIIVISKDGQNSKVLISEEGGLKHPWCICFKHNESSGFICDFYGTYLATFNLSS